jgi:hypothetical protein
MCKGFCMEKMAEIGNKPLKLLIKSPCVWAIVWPANPYFILDLRVAKKWAKFDTGHLMKLGASCQALQDSVGSDKARFRLGVRAKKSWGPIMGNFSAS